MARIAKAKRSPQEKSSTAPKKKRSGRRKTVPKVEIERTKKRNKRLSKAPEPMEENDASPVFVPEKRERLRDLASKARRIAYLTLRVVAVVVCIAGTIAAGRLIESYVRTSKAFAIRDIQLSGNQKLSRDEVLAAAGVIEEQNAFAISPDDAQARLLRHPWVAAATVVRRLPSQFTISVREHHAVALLALGSNKEDTVAGQSDVSSGLYLVSDDATVFKQVAPGDPVDQPVITGVSAERFAQDKEYRSSVLLDTVALMHDYRGAGLWRREPIGEIHTNGDSGLSLFVGEDATLIRLGRAPFRSKLRKLRRVFDRLRERKERPSYVYLDNIRRPDRITVKLR